MSVINLKTGKPMNMGNLVYFWEHDGKGYNCKKGMPLEMLGVLEWFKGARVITESEFNSMDIKLYQDWG